MYLKCEYKKMSVTAIVFSRGHATTVTWPRRHCENVAYSIRPLRQLRGRSDKFTCTKVRNKFGHEIVTFLVSQYSYQCCEYRRAS
jgi:hypothetical protein